MDRKRYRVWMKDGYGSMQIAGDEAEARTLAIAAAQKTIEGCAMSATEKRAAVTVDYVEQKESPATAAVR